MLAWMIKMTDKELDIQINKYLSKNWGEITDDIARLIRIPSSVEDSEFSEKYPSGTGACKAMKEGLSIAKRMGFKTKNHKNIIGIADIKGKSKTQIGFIGHMDVVPPGPGWKFNPYDLSVVGDYMIGRGIIDDKGPTVMLLHAINFWLKQDVEFPYSVRFLFGTDEETKSDDIKCFKKDFEEPRIVITPDADFPICYGEKGLFRFCVKSKKITQGEIVDIKAGVSDNAVAGRATAIIKTQNKWIDTTGSKLAHAIKVNRIDNKSLEIIATGRSAHAADPYEGIDSIAVLSQFMLEQNIGNKDEKSFLKFLTKIAGKPHGEEVGINAFDEHFKDLTIVPSKLKYQNGIFQQIFDIRYPMSTDDKKITSQIKKHLPKGSKFIPYKSVGPFLINPQSRLINALAKSYTEATGEFAKIFTMGGATYAREFQCGTSFGPLMNWIAHPAWVGTLHSPDEGISIEMLKTSFNIYVYTIKYLMELDIESQNFIKNARTVF